MNDAAPRRPRSLLRRFFVWTLLGVGIGVAASLVILAIANRDPTPRLTPAEFAAARERWAAAAPADYDIVIRVRGPQPATYRVEVRGGQALAAWRNDAPLTSIRTFGTWSVPGMFSTISRDVDVIERLAEGRPVPGAAELILKARFDPKYSFPQHYQRIEWGSRRGSNAVTVTWDVIEFTVR